MRGRTIPLSLPRRLVDDLLAFAVKIPIVPIQRSMRLGPLKAARAASSDPPPWVALFTKGFGLVASEFPELRRVYLKYPWSRIYEYPVSMATISVERSFKNEPAVLGVRIKDPAMMPIGNISLTIREAQTAPINEVPEFRRLLNIARLPRVVRRLLIWIALNSGRQRPHFLGTFVVTDLSPLGAESLRPLTLASVALYYGRISESGEVMVRAAYDHRVFDGATMARALVRLEELLNTVVSSELQSNSSGVAISQCEQ